MFFLALSAILNFPGLGYTFADFQVRAPVSDANGAAGLTQYVQWVNTSYAVFDKSTGDVMYGPVPGNTLWKGFGGLCEENNDGDPVVLYDRLANRWVMSQFAATNGPPYYQCVAVSTTPDATGSFYQYAFEQPDIPDYPKLGVWPDGYYLTLNLPSGARACVLDRGAMLQGQPAAQQCFSLSAPYANLLPSDLDGRNPPPDGSPNYFAALGTDSLLIWRFHVDWATPANSTFTGPVLVPVEPFTQACGGGVCIPQYGTMQKLDSLGDRLMYRLAYRNFGDHESLVVNHSVSAGAGVGVRWYELRDLAAGPAVYQQGTFAPDDGYRWMGSVAMDGAGNIALGFSVSAKSMFPSIRYTGREAGDPPGTMHVENSIFEGLSPQTNSGRWGDYSGMALDPVDDCTFWYTNQYASVARGGWSTRIAAFRFGACGGSPGAGTGAAGTDSTHAASRVNTFTFPQ